MVQGPNGLVPTNVNPQSPTGIGQVGPTQAQGVPPSGQVITDSLGRQFRYNAQTNQLEPVGGSSPIPTPGAGASFSNVGSPAAGNVTGMAQDDRGRYAQISQEGTNAQTGAQLADQVGELAQEVRTGKLSGEWADRLAVLQQHDPSLTARQMLSKYAAQLKTMAEQGASTDASRSQIEQGMPNPATMGPDAVAQAADYVGGIFRMRGARQAYADQYVKSNGSSVGIRGADDSFMQAADPTVFAYNALPAGAARQQYLKERFGNDPQKIRAFIARLNQVKHYAGAIQ